MTTFLPKAYQYKEIGDYNIDPKIVVTMLNAEMAITAAEEFLTCIGSILA